jgi:hypothetical protein
MCTRDRIRWNNLHQVHSKSKDWKAKWFKVLQLQHLLSNKPLSQGFLNLILSYLAKGFCWWYNIFETPWTRSATRFRVNLMKVIPWTRSATRFRVNLMKVIPWTRSVTRFRVNLHLLSNKPLSQGFLNLILSYLAKGFCWWYNIFETYSVTCAHNYDEIWYWINRGIINNIMAKIKTRKGQITEPVLPLDLEWTWWRLFHEPVLSLDLEWTWWRLFHEPVLPLDLE